MLKASSADSVRPSSELHVSTIYVERAVKRTNGSVAVVVDIDTGISMRLAGCINVLAVMLVGVTTRSCHAFRVMLVGTRPASSRILSPSSVYDKAPFSSLVGGPSCNRRFPAFSTSSDVDSEKSVVTPTWTYTPYQPPKNKPQQRRGFSSSAWKVPKQVRIPEDQLELTFVRSSGAGGQNVNKVNTKVEARFHVMSASWLPSEVRERLVQQQSNRVNKEGYMSLSSQEYRTQSQNRKDILVKLESIILQAYERPKDRKMRKGISKKAKERNTEFKRRRSEVKKSRGRVDF